MMLENTYWIKPKHHILAAHWMDIPLLLSVSLLTLEHRASWLYLWLCCHDQTWEIKTYIYIFNFAVFPPTLKLGWEMFVSTSSPTLGTKLKLTVGQANVLQVLFSFIIYGMWHLWNLIYLYHNLHFLFFLAESKDWDKWFSLWPNKHP